MHKKKYLSYFSVKKKYCVAANANFTSAFNHSKLGILVQVSCNELQKESHLSYEHQARSNNSTKLKSKRIYFITCRNTARRKKLNALENAGSIIRIK